MKKSFTVTLTLEDIRYMSNNPNLNLTETQFQDLIEAVEASLNEGGYLAHIIQDEVLFLDIE